MSVVIIGGGGGKAAIDKLVGASPNMTAIQRAQAEALLQKLEQDIEALIAAVKSP